MKNIIEEIRNGKYDAQLPVWWEKIKKYDLGIIVFELTEGF